MRRAKFRGAVAVAATIGALSALTFGGNATGSPPAAEAADRVVPDPVSITPDDCSAAVLGDSIEAAAIGEATTGATLTTFTWSANPVPYCDIRGAIHPIDPDAPPINFRVSLPATWTHRAAQYGGAGLNGSVVNTTGNIAEGWVGLGSDSGHSFGTPDWPANEESVKNFGYMQLKKTHDVAWEVIERAYGSAPVYSYFFGGSQGGREGLTVAQRYPDDYDGVSVSVPVVGFSTLMLEFVILRQQEIPLDNWVTPAKATAIAAEIMRQCDALDALADGVINNYAACRANFDPDETPNDDPWRDKRCPDGIDPNPTDTSSDACLTDGQISTLETTYSKYEFTSPLAYGTTSHGFAVPSVDVVGSFFRRFIVPTRYQGQEGAGADAPVTSWNAAPVILGTLFEDLDADPITYVEGDPYFEQRRLLASEWLDSTDPDLTEFYEGGGKLLVTVGAADNTAASGAQLDYYASVNEFMGPDVVDRFARLWVVPQGGHGLTGSNASTNGYGEPVPSFSLPSGFDQNGAVVAWVEDGVAPPLHPIVSSANRSWPLCTYPMYPRYDGQGAVEQSSSYRCADPARPWDSTVVYDEGDRVLFDGGEWEALWWTQNQSPGSPHGPWQEFASDEDGTPIWTPSRIFDTGDQVVHAGTTYEAQWWTRNQEPGDPYGPWQETSTTEDGTAIWAPSQVYVEGDRVVHDAVLYEARWWTRNQEPSDPYGPWMRID